MAREAPACDIHTPALRHQMHYFGVQSNRKVVEQFPLGVFKSKSKTNSKRKGFRFGGLFFWRAWLDLPAGRQVILKLRVLIQRPEM